MTRLWILVLTVALVGTLLAGCAPRLWAKPGGTQEEFARDKYQCLSEASYVGQQTYVNTYSGYSQPGAYVNYGLFHSCMEARGWQLRSDVKPF